LPRISFFEKEMLQANIFKRKLHITDMAKKRAARRERSPVKKATTAPVKSKKGKVAFVLMAISAVLLLVNGILLVIARKWLAAMLGTVGYSIPVASLLTYGIIWIVLGILLWVTTVRIRKENAKSEKWLLLALSIIVMISGRLESGVLALIAALLYLNEK